MPAPAKKMLQDAIEHQQLSVSSFSKLSGSHVLSAQGIQKVKGSFIFKRGFKRTFVNPSNAQSYGARKIQV